MTAPVRLPYEVTVNGPVTLVKFTEAILDEGNLRPAAEELDALAERSGQEEIQLDFGGVNFLSSFGLTRLVLLRQRLQAAGGRLVLLNVPDLLLEVFRVTGLLSVLDVRTGKGKRVTG